MRSLVSLPLSALICATLTTSPAPSQPSAARRAPPGLTDADAVCAPIFARWQNGYDDRAGYGRGRGGAAAYPGPPPVQFAPPAPPPPPPAPPPPPSPAPVAEQSASDIAVTGSAQRRAPMSSPSAVGVVGPPPPAGYAAQPADRERYSGEPVATVQSVAEIPVSTFSVDVDTGSYANVRRMLTRGQMPPQAAVRTEEMLNYFRYDYPAPQDRSRPFTVSADMTTTPWNAETRLLRVGLRGYDLPRAERPPANLVFLVDVSGSMEEVDKLPLVQCSLALAARSMGPRDRIAIVAYAGAAGLVLPSSSNRNQVIEAITRLQAGGSTAGGAGIQLAYRTARENLIEGGINRVILATDGDFNVGITNNETLIDMVERERASGITLTALGYGTGNYNEAMMEQIADHGNGNYSYIDSPREAQKVLEQELASTLFTIAHDVKIQVEFNPAYVSEYRLIGYENRALREQDFDNDAVDAGEIGAGHQVTALYEIVPAGARGWLPDRRYPANQRAGEGASNGELAFLRLRYKLPGEDQSRLIERPLAAALIRSARAPVGDSAFAAAVAAYGQRLRGDPWLNGFGFADARRLAQSAVGDDLWRQEFVRLAEAAEQHSVKGAAAGGTD
jgi:Ca-activated chloride channel family protein